MKKILCLLWILLAVPLYADEPVLTAKYTTETYTPTSTEITLQPSATATQTAPAAVSGTASPVTHTAEPAPEATATPVVLLPETINTDNTDMYAVKLYWVPAGDPAKIYYDILRRADTGIDYETLNKQPVNQINEYKDTTIEPGKAYYYIVAAYDGNGNTQTSKELYVKTAQVFPPGKPGNFRALQDIESISLRWESSQKGTHDITEYRLYRGTAAEAIELYQHVPKDKKNYDDTALTPGMKYYYKLSAIDEKGNETYSDVTAVSIAYPKPMTGLILMPSAFRNDIFNNNGLNVDMAFSYYIGSIAGEHNIYPYGKGSDAFEKIGVWLLTGDVKFTLFDPKDPYPSVGTGYIYTLLLQDKIGASSEKTGVGVQLSTKKNDSLSYYSGFYLNTSKEIIWGIRGHAGYIFGSAASFMNYLTEFMPTRTGADGKDQVNYPNAYYAGFSYPLFGNIGMKTEYIVPGARRNALLPDLYLINTQIDKLLNFNFSYLKYPGGYAWLGYFSFRFTIYPNPYKVDAK